MSRPRVSVIIPAYCEEKLIRKTLDGIPARAEQILVVDDASPDNTAREVSKHSEERVELIAHETNQGVGAAILSGYRRAWESGSDIFVVMAGDNQMDPVDLEPLIAPLENGSADYVKGNRLAHSRASDMPRLRRQGTQFLAQVTSQAAGLRLADTQCGYTALSRSAYELIADESIWRTYGYPNDMLIALATRGARISEVPVRPVYADEKSGLRPWHMISILRVIARRVLLDGLSPRARPLAEPDASASRLYQPESGA